MRTMLPKGRPGSAGAAANGSGGHRHPAGKASDAQALAGKHLLVVDDNQFNLMLTQEMLRCAGATVTLCRGGLEAVEQLRMAPSSFDCVLMDVQMPDMDGYQTTGMIRAALKLLSLPVIAVTADASPSAHQAALAAGMDDFIGKPINVTQLISMISYYCRWSRNADKLPTDDRLQHQGADSHDGALHPDGRVLAPLPAPLVRRGRVLVVDDDHFGIHTLYQILRPELDLFMARSGADAIAFCLATPPDLVLLDVNMPDMDGLETCRRLKANAQTASLPVIFVTAGTMIDEEDACWMAGGVDFVSKPIIPLTLRNRVRAHLQIKFHADELRMQRDDILSTLAHEVQRPVGNASAALDSAIDAFALPAADRQPALERLKRAGSALHGVIGAIDNTLANSVLLAGRDAPALHDTDVDMLIELACADIDPQQRGRIERTHTDAPRTARMHLGLMRLALRNLLANALAYSPPDSKVVIDVSERHHPEALQLAVRDLGSGLTPQQLSNVIARGVRGDQAKQSVGHGLGLYIVRRVVDLHGGTLTAKANQPQGLVMQLTLPQAGPR